MLRWLWNSSVRPDSLAQQESTAGWHHYLERSLAMIFKCLGGIACAQSTPNYWITKLRDKENNTVSVCLKFDTVDGDRSMKTNYSNVLLPAQMYECWPLSACGQIGRSHDKFVWFGPWVPPHDKNGVCCKNPRIRFGVVADKTRAWYKSNICQFLIPLSSQKSGRCLRNEYLFVPPFQSSSCIFTKSLP